MEDYGSPVLGPQILLPESINWRIFIFVIYVFFGGGEGGEHDVPLKVTRIIFMCVIPVV